MIGSGFKKMAAAQGMAVANGVAYGSYHGYAATFSEGAGWKRVTFTTRISQSELVTLRGVLGDRNLSKEFRIQDLRLEDGRLDFMFLDNPGTLKKIQSFLDFILLLLDQAGASKADTCWECGTPLTERDPWKLMNGAAYHLHSSCANHITQKFQAEQARQQETDTGTVLSGAVGAFLGAIVGAIPWALVMYFGYIASVMGLLIGWCSKKGYELFHGKNNVAKVVLVILASLLGVVAGSLGGEAISLAVMIAKGEIAASMADIPALFGILFQNSEYVAALTKDLLLGTVFALLGMRSIFQQLKAEREDTGFAMQDLN